MTTSLSGSANGSGSANSNAGGNGDASGSSTNAIGAGRIPRSRLGHAVADSRVLLGRDLKHLLRNRPIYGYRFEGTRYDAGDKLGFLKATVEFALRRHDLGKDFREYLRTLEY